jgi:hypothetical protein
MFPPLQWDKFHLKVWSWLIGKPLQIHMQFEMEYDLVRYENKDETTNGIHSLNFQMKIILKVLKTHPKGPLANKCGMHWNVHLKESKESLRSWSSS